MNKTILVSAALLVLMGAGCGQSITDAIGQKVAEKVTEKAIEGQTGNKVDINSNDKSVSVTDSKTGATWSSGENVKFPDSFPTDVPKYEKGTLNMVSQNEAEGQVGYIAQSTEAKADVLAWFKDQATSKGWKLNTSMDIDKMTISEWTREDGAVKSSFSLSVTPDDTDAAKLMIVVSRNILK